MDAIRISCDAIGTSKDEATLRESEPARPADDGGVAVVASIEDPPRCYKAQKNETRLTRVCIALKFLSNVSIPCCLCLLYCSI